jgi:cation transport regulator
MPYHSNAQLPQTLQTHLPLHAQDIYRQAFNQAFIRYADEALAHRVAWAAVKKSYVKLGETWIRRAGVRLRY